MLYLKNVWLWTLNVVHSSAWWGVVCGKHAKADIDWTVSCDRFEGITLSKLCELPGGHTSEWNVAWNQMFELQTGFSSSSYNPSTYFGKPRQVGHLRLGIWDQSGQCGKTLSLLKSTKIRQAWWHTPVIPATQEAEAGESLEPGRQRLQWAKIMSLHSSLGDRARLHLKK